MKNFNEIVKLFPGMKFRGDINTSVKGITSDSREVEKDDLFVVYKGISRDGSMYINEALNKGASGIVVQSGRIERGDVNILELDEDDKKYSDTVLNLSKYIYNNPSDKLKIIGITGTNGKTTTSFFLRNILKIAEIPSGMLGTIRHMINDEKIIARNTTPPAVELVRLFGKMIKKNIKYVVMEVSSHALSIGRIEGIDFSGAIYTNFGRDHLDFHGSEENYFKAKKKLFSNLKTNSFACLYSEIKNINRILDTIKCPFFLYSLTGNNDRKVTYSARIIHQSTEGSSIVLNSNKNSVKLNIKIPGTFNVLNALAAFSAAEQSGIEIDAVKHGLETLEKIPGRFESITSSSVFSIYIDYAHTPEALNSLLTSLRKLLKRNGRLICVFGCGGDRDKIKRAEMGSIAELLSDKVIITTDNPRNENPMDIAEDILSGIKGKCELILDREEAVDVSIKNAKENDIVVICGKGHENHQILKDRTIDFSDNECVKKSLSRRGWL